MDSEPDAVPPVLRALCLGEGFSGEEKIPEMASMPYSSRRPVSLRVIPVFLEHSISLLLNAAIMDAQLTGLGRQHRRTEVHDFPGSRDLHVSAQGAP